MPFVPLPCPFLGFWVFWIFLSPSPSSRVLNAGAYEHTRPSYPVESRQLAELQREYSREPLQAAVIYEPGVDL
ncbi:hypothetical protein F5B21DRAFT_100779 [Xylaria acuta]|nr:hypothetical protein F5B21DRAFT_100779 [Xylaria acuta]